MGNVIVIPTIRDFEADAKYLRNKEPILLVGREDKSITLVENGTIIPIVNPETD